MLGGFSKRIRNLVFLLCLLQIMVIAQIISVDLSSLGDSSMMPTTKTSQSVLPKSVTEVRNADLNSYIVNTTSDQGSKGNISDKGTFDNNLASKIPPQNIYDQFIVPVNETWSSFGNLTLGMLASNEFYGNTQRNTSSVTTRNTTNQQNRTTVISNTSKNVNEKGTSSVTDTQIKGSNNAMMTQGQLDALANQFTQVQQTARNTIPNTVVSPKTTNFQFTSSGLPQQTQRSTDSIPNLATNPPPAFDFSSNSPYVRTTTDNNVFIQGLADTINSRFNNFFGS